jgi:uncharacterized caspase-like protein
MVAPASVVAPQSPATPLRPELHYAVVVGINRYPGLPTNLRGPRNDAQQFYDWLRDPCGGRVPEANIRLIKVDEQDEARFTSPDVALPTRDLINNALDDVMTNLERHLKGSPLDWQHTRLYLYLSGHGVAANAREAALLMANARLGRLGDSIPCAPYMAFFQDAQTFRELVCFADCCRTAKAQAQMLGPPFDRRSANRGPVATVLGFATNFGDLAYEPTPEEEADPDLTRGFFTTALLEGLRGGAVDELTGEINSNSLARYVRRRVLDLTQTRPVPQQAPMSADPAAPIVFRPAASPPVWSVTISFPAGFTGAVALSDGKGRDVGRYEGAPAPWVVPLPNDYYEVRPAEARDGSGFNKDGLFRVLGEDRHVQL